MVSLVCMIQQPGSAPSLIDEQAYYLRGRITGVNKPPAVTSGCVNCVVTDTVKLRRFNHGHHIIWRSPGWLDESADKREMMTQNQPQPATDDDFIRTEATDLLKTKDRPRDRTQIRTDLKGKGVKGEFSRLGGAVFFHYSQFRWPSQWRLPCQLSFLNGAKRTNLAIPNGEYLAGLSF